MIFWAGEASAQDETRELTDAQFEMNNKAVEAVNNKEYAKAIKLYQASLALGEVNITYLNMARTYHRMGECATARRVYRKTREARYKISNPSPVEINAALNAYETQLYKDCEYGELVVKCEPGKMDLYLNTKGPMDCPGEDEPLRVKEGDYVLRGEMEGYTSSEIVVKVARVDPTTVVLTLARKSADVVEKPLPERIIIETKNDGSREKLEEISKRLEIEAREKAEKEQRGRDAELARQRQLDDERVMMLAVSAKEAELVRKNRRTMLFAGIASGSMIVFGAVWDSCLGFGGVDARLNGNNAGKFCAHTYDKRLTGKDAIPIGFYAGGIITYLVTRRIVRVRKEEFDLNYKIAPSEPQNR